MSIGVETVHEDELEFEPNKDATHRIFVGWDNLYVTVEQLIELRAEIDMVLTRKALGLG